MQNVTTVREVWYSWYDLTISLVLTTFGNRPKKLDFVHQAVLRRTWSGTRQTHRMIVLILDYVSLLVHTVPYLVSSTLLVSKDKSSVLMKYYHHMH